MTNKLTQKTASQVLREQGSYMVYVAAGLATREKRASGIRERILEAIAKNSAGASDTAASAARSVGKSFDDFDEVIGSNIGGRKNFDDIRESVDNNINTGVSLEDWKNMPEADQGKYDLNELMFGPGAASKPKPKPAAPAETPEDTGLVHMPQEPPSLADMPVGSGKSDDGSNVARNLGLGVGAGGAVGTVGGYGMGDADTTPNKLKNMSNDMLGTDFDTQSRFDRLING